VLESLRSVHFKEGAKSRLRLERLQSDHQTVSNILSQLDRDEKLYTSQLSFDKEGSKVNPIRVNGLTSIDAEQIGKHIIELYKNWRPGLPAPSNELRSQPAVAPEGGYLGTDQKIGSIYGFDFYIRQQQESYEEKGLFSYRTHNGFYVQHKDGGIKYTYNQGHPPADNPKLAARHFLNALDRVTKIREQYQKEFHDLDNAIPVLQKIVERPFEKEEELKTMKQELSRLEREISLKIQETKLKEQEQHKEAPVIKMNIKEEKQEPVQRVRRSRGMRL